MTSIDCVILLPDGRQSGFWIEAKCPLSKLKSNLLKQLGLQVDSVFVRSLLDNSEGRELLGDDRWLIEDHSVKQGNQICIKGKFFAGRGKGLPDCINLTAILVYSSLSSSTLVPPPKRCSIFIRKKSQIRQMMPTFTKGLDFVPESIEFWDAKGEHKLNLTHTPEEAGLVNGGEMQVRGFYFPISVFGPKVEFLSNKGIRVSQECAVCLEPLMDGKVFEPCGHVCVCNSCALDKCPLCSLTK